MFIQHTTQPSINRKQRHPSTSLSKPPPYPTKLSQSSLKISFFILLKQKNHKLIPKGLHVYRQHMYNIPYDPDGG